MNALTSLATISMWLMNSPWQVIDPYPALQMDPVPFIHNLETSLIPKQLPLIYCMKNIVISNDNIYPMPPFYKLNHIKRQKTKANVGAWVIQLVLDEAFIKKDLDGYMYETITSIERTRSDVTQ
eukprot:8091802-Ditylum_brightwellii.AAC.1